MWWSKWLKSLPLISSMSRYFSRYFRGNTYLLFFHEIFFFNFVAGVEMTARFALNGTRNARVWNKPREFFQCHYKRIATLGWVRNEECWSWWWSSSCCGCLLFHGSIPESVRRNITCQLSEASTFISCFPWCLASTPCFALLWRILLGLKMLDTHAQNNFQFCFPAHACQSKERAICTFLAKLINIAT